ncbi:MAG: lysine biosynthesis protein LysX [Euryarchaeota archaeon]|nr:lysine biosynthesis protein LysX [Euryarchaeota archaeon]
MVVRIGLLASRIRVDEKMLIESARDMPGVELVRIDDSTMSFDIHEAPPEVDVVLERSVSHSRAIYALKFYERHGIPTVNTLPVAEVCGDKVQTSLELARAGVPTPRTKVAFTPEAALAACEELGYPCVMKPTVGSWARLVSRIDSREAAESIIEHKEVLGSYLHHIYYIQEHVPKPGRDIRSFVVGDECIAAIYRTNDKHWITNTSRGAVASNCPVTDEIAEISLAAAKAVGGGVLAIDIMEAPEGLVVHEVNYTMEFRNSVAPTGVDIPRKILEHTVQVANAVPARPQQVIAEGRA